jgi:hypothetical protein
LDISQHNGIRQEQAREAFEEKITILRQRGGEILEALELLEEEKQDRKQHEYKAKNSLQLASIF